MADARLNASQLSDILRRLDEIAEHTRSVRRVVLEVMADRRAERAPRSVAAAPAAATRKSRPARR
jgi:hypothetical protein